MYINLSAIVYPFRSLDCKSFIMLVYLSVSSPKCLFLFCLSVCFSVFPSVNYSLSLSIWMSIGPSLSVSVYNIFFVSVGLSDCLSFCLSFFNLLCLSFYLIYVRFFTSLSVYLSDFLCLCVTISTKDGTDSFVVEILEIF